MPGGLPLAAAPKGPDRNAGRGWFHHAGAEPIEPPEDLPGPGPALKRRLPSHFSGARPVRKASLEDLEAAPARPESTPSAAPAEFHRPSASNAAARP